MKKVLIVLCISAAFYACGGGGKSTGSDSSATGGSDTSAAKPAASIDLSTPGGKLINGSDCLTCHKVDSKVIGPSYQDVAAKYASANDATIDSLATKIIKGGSGHWGAVSMTPHPTVSMDDAKTMVKYILSLKK